MEMVPRRFALIGAAGFVAPRHLKAIKDTGNSLVAALDPNDSVGVLDNFFPDADFFVEFERFDRHLDKLRRRGPAHAVDMVSVCSPNYLHDAHVRFGLRAGADVICEKPLVLNPWNIDGLCDVERDTGRRIFTVLQLRLHPAILALRDRVRASDPAKVFDVDLTYITARGNWYHYAWKGDERKSGGVATNIGVHFYDMLHMVFGDVQRNVVHHRDTHRAAGYLEFQRARVRWFLSVDAADIPEPARSRGARTYRELAMNGEAFEFSEGFSDLHTRVYADVMDGGGFGLEEARTAIEIVSEIRAQAPCGAQGDYHPLLGLRA
jgi:UDP-N-acetyl-2-amino-2-deoxyglucuronate dehydrogenase